MSVMAISITYIKRALKIQIREGVAHNTHELISASFLLIRQSTLFFLALSVAYPTPPQIFLSSIKCLSPFPSTTEHQRVPSSFS